MEYLSLSDLHHWHQVSRFIACAPGAGAFTLMAGWPSDVCVDHIFFPFIGHFGCFHILTLADNAAVRVGGWASPKPAFISFEHMPSLGWRVVWEGGEGRRGS